MLEIPQQRDHSSFEEEQGKRKKKKENKKCRHKHKVNYLYRLQTQKIKTNQNRRHQPKRMRTLLDGPKLNHHLAEKITVLLLS